MKKLLKRLKVNRNLKEMAKWNCELTESYVSSRMIYLYDSQGGSFSKYFKKFDYILNEYDEKVSDIFDIYKKNGYYLSEENCNELKKEVDNIADEAFKKVGEAMSKLNSKFVR